MYLVGYFSRRLPLEDSPKWVWWCDRRCENWATP